MFAIALIAHCFLYQVRRDIRKEYFGVLKGNRSRRASAVPDVRSECYTSVDEMKNVDKIGNVGQMGNVNEIGNVGEMGNVDKIGNVGEMGNVDKMVNVDKIGNVGKMVKVSNMVNFG